MRLDLPDWVGRAPADIDGLLVMLREREARLAEDVAETRQWIKKAERLATAMRDWSTGDDPVATLRSKAGALPRSRPAQGSTAAVLSHEHAQIRAVLEHDPQRWWTPQEVCDVLGHADASTVHDALSDMAGQELLLKHPDGGYRLLQVPSGIRADGDGGDATA